MIPLTEQLPLKQGLRPGLGRNTGDNAVSHRATSTKTRIKTIVDNEEKSLSMLTEQLPLKQGLRLIGTSFEVF